MELAEIHRRVMSLDRALRDNFDVEALYVFGSVARGEATQASDVDIIVDFRSAPSFARFMDLKFFLEDSLGVRVDLVTRRALRASMRARVEAEAKRVA